jgi:hypothetical protein
MLPCYTMCETFDETKAESPRTGQPYQNKKEIRHQQSCSVPSCPCHLAPYTPNASELMSSFYSRTHLQSFHQHLSCKQSNLEVSLQGIAANFIIE